MRREQTGPERPPALASTAPPSSSRTSRQPSPAASPSRSSHPPLGKLSLHSPSSIVGTPFDLSPRFEYPFPSPSSASTASPSVYDRDGVPSPYGHVPFGAYGHGHVPGWAGFPVSASLPDLSVTASQAAGPPYAFAPHGHPWAMGPGAHRAQNPMHPKLRLREPPIPPSLAKKRRIMREREAGLRLEAQGALRTSMSEIIEPRRAYTEAELEDTTPMDTVRQQSLPLPSDVDIPRPASLERRESDETVVGSSEGRGDDEKIPLDEICPPNEPAMTLITTAEDTQVDSPTLGLIVSEEPEVDPTTVADVRHAQGDAHNEADVPGPFHGSPASALLDVSDARLDALPAFSLAAIATSPSAVCTSDFCPAFHDAAPANDGADIDTRTNILGDTALRQGATGPLEQIHEPHDIGIDYDCDIHDTNTNEEEAPALIHDGSRPLASDLSVPDPTFTALVDPVAFGSSS